MDRQADADGAVWARAAQATATFRGRPQSAKMARDLVTAVLAVQGVRDATVITDAQLLTSELVTWAIRGSGGALFSVAVATDALTTAVALSGRGLPAPTLSPATTRAALDGGALFLAALAQGWGADADQFGRTVWFRLACYPGRPTPPPRHCPWRR